MDRVDGALRTWGATTTAEETWLASGQMWSGRAARAVGWSTPTLGAVMRRRGCGVRLRVVAVVVLLATGCSGSGSDDEDASNGDAQFAEMTTTAGSFLELNGWMWFYTTADGISFAEVTGLLDDLHNQGIGVVGIYSPYDGDPDKWLGCVARDFYDVTPASGTLDDFTGLVDAAHRRGMKVVAYFGNLNIDHESEFFHTAEEQYATGDHTSREVSAFHWADDDQGRLPTPAFGPSEWAWSPTAGAYYWSFWGEAGFDLDLPGARAEVTRAETFWLDQGLDGFMFDSGIADAELQEAMVDLPSTGTPNDKWLTFEATDAEHADTYADFGLTSWFNLEDNDEENDYSLVAAGPATADDLDEALAGAWEAHDAGKLTHAWSPFEADAYPDPRMRTQEAALLAGTGIAYGAPSYTEHLAWPDTTRADWAHVLTTVAGNPALTPAASRTRVPSGSDPKTYALLSTATDRSQTVLLAFNLQAQPATVPIDLTGTEVAADQTPRDLYSGRPAPPITGPDYALDLPAYGFAILQVQTTP